MRALLSTFTLTFGLLVLPGCTAICTDEIRYSPKITVVDAVSGEPVTSAVVTFTLDGGPERMPLEDGFDQTTGRFTLAMEEDGLFAVTIEADGYEPMYVEYDVDEDGCHVEVIDDTVELVPL